MVSAMVNIPINILCSLFSFCSVGVVNHKKSAHVTTHSLWFVHFTAIWIQIQANQIWPEDKEAEKMKMNPVKTVQGL